MAYQIRQDWCSCCHRCKIVCPAGAVSFKNAKYWIDPEKCIGCGACARNCHNCAISKIGEAPEVIPHEPVRKECDLVVVGSGGSGLVCAVRTAQMTGKKVIVLEKNGKPGGNTWYASGFGANYSKMHKEAGVPDTREEDLRRFLMETLWQEDPRLVYNVFQATEGFLDWLMEDCGASEDFVLARHPAGFMIPRFVNHSGKKWKRIDTSIGPGGAGSFVIEKLLKKAEEVGVEIITGCGAEHLIQDESGAVIGVQARDAGGIVEISAKKVVLSTGCFSHSEEYLRRMCPGFFREGEPTHRFSVPTCTGDGIRMSEEIGADIDEVNTQALVLGPAHHPYAFSLVCMVRESETVMVDRTGKRFASEQDNCMTLRKINAKLPGNECWAIMDGPMMEQLSARIIDRAMDGPAGVEIMKGYKKDLEEEIALGKPVHCADTFEELAEQLGIPADTFAGTMNRYNSFCENGRDADFFKDPRFLMPVNHAPYYAIYCKTFQENAVGGMKINSSVQVLNKAGEPIPNLYATGDNTRGVRLAGDLGPDLVERTVSNLTWAFASGFIASENMIKVL